MSEPYAGPRAELLEEARAFVEPWKHPGRKFLTPEYLVHCLLGMVENSVPMDMVTAQEMIRDIAHSGEERPDPDNLLSPANWTRVNKHDHAVVAPLGVEAGIKAQMFRLNNAALARVIAEAQRIIRGRVEDGIPE
jgi:hypothetical protein